MKPGLSCSVCTHAKRADIDADGRSVVRVAKRFGVSKSALDRHRNHPTKTAPKSDTVPPPTSERDAILDALARLRQSLSKAELDDLPRIADAITKMGKRLEIIDLGRELTFDELMRSKAWRTLLDRIALALKPHPEAALALARAFGSAA